MRGNKGQGSIEALTDNVRAFVQNIVERDFSGNSSAAAREMGIGQATMSQFLSGKRKLTFVVLVRIVTYGSGSFDKVLYGKK